MSSLGLGARLCVARLRSRRFAVGGALAAFAIAFGALLERSTAEVGAADRALSGAAFGIVLPLAALFTVDLVCDGGRLDTAVELLARAGANRRAAGLGVLGVAALALALVGLFTGTLTILLARSFSDPDLLRDLLATSWIGALSGAAYAAWFVLGSAVGRGPRGRFWALALDWLLGSLAGPVAEPFPRAHVRGLLTAPPPPGFSIALAALLLVGCALAYSLLSVGRCPP